MIYPINEQITALMESFINPDTGELLDGVTEEMMEESIKGLEMDFNEKIDSLCCAFKNLKAEAADIKDEKMRLAKREASAENGRDRTKRFLAYLLQGEKFKSAKNSLYYTSSEALEVKDENELVQWCKMNAPGFLNEPTVRIDDLKKAIKNGLDCPFAEIKKNNSLVVR